MWVDVVSINRHLCICRSIAVYYLYLVSILFLLRTYINAIVFCYFGTKQTNSLCQYKTIRIDYVSGELVLERDHIPLR